MKRFTIRTRDVLALYNCLLWAFSKKQKGVTTRADASGIAEPEDAIHLTRYMLIGYLAHLISAPRWASCMS